MSPLKRGLSTFRNLGRRYALLFSAGLLSDIGGFSTHTALLLHVYHLTGENAAYMGMMALANLLPMALGAPLGGVWAEKYNRKYVMIANDLARIPLVLMMMTTHNVWLLFALASMTSACTSIFMPSRNSIIPELVRKDQVHLANALNAGIMSFVHVAGPVVGAVVYAKTQTITWIVVFNAATYTWSAALLFMLAYQRVAPTMGTAAAGMLREIYLGFRYVRREPDLFQMLMIFMTSGFAIGLLIPLIRPFVSEVLSGDDRTYAWVIGAFGFGGMVAPGVGYWAGRRFGLGRVISSVFVIETVLMVVWCRTPWVWASCAILFVWGVAIFTMFPCYMSYLHTYARKDFLGRTFALMDQATYMPHTIAAGLVWGVAGDVSTQKLLTVTALAYFVMMLFMQALPGMRLLRSRRGETEEGDPAEVAA
jgi:MFS family permease